MIEQIIYLTVGYVLGVISFVLFIRYIRNSRIINKTKLDFYKELEK